MSYYRGDYYRGDYYRRGDPGIFSFIGNAAKAVGGLIGGPVGGVLSAAGGVLSPNKAQAATVPTTTALAMPVLQRPLIGVGNQGPNATVMQIGGGGMAQVPGTPPTRGYHWNRSAYYTRAGRVEKGTKLVRNRHANVGNARALTHSLRRAHGFARLARHVMSFEITGRKHGRGHFKARRRR